jgi:hypothetical protein
VREDPRNANLLFVGTDLGVYATLNGGVSWTKLRGSEATGAAGGGGRGGAGGGGRGGGAATTLPRGLLPTVPVHDMKIHPRDRELVVATHARGIYIADISAYEEITPAVLAADASLLDIVPYIQWTATGRGAVSGQNFQGMSRPNDIAINYYLKSAVTGDVRVRIHDGSRVIAEMTGTKNAGLNTVRWNLMGRRESIAGEAASGGGRGGRGGGGGGGGRAGGAGAAGPDPAGPPTVPTPVDVGDYRVVLTVNGKDYERTVMVLPDPRRR